MQHFLTFCLFRGIEGIAHNLCEQIPLFRILADLLLGNKHWPVPSAIFSGFLVIWLCFFGGFVCALFVVALFSFSYVTSQYQCGQFFCMDFSQWVNISNPKELLCALLPACDLHVMKTTV